jgi:hypothetical protein
MTNPMIRIHDTETNEIVDREMTNAEFAEYQIDINASAERKAKEEADLAAKLAILQQLGLTDEQAIVLGLLPKPQEEQSTPSVIDEA